MKNIIENLKKANKSIMEVFVISLLVIVILLVLNSKNNMYMYTVSHLFIGIISASIFLLTTIMIDKTGDNTFKIFGSSFIFVALLHIVLIVVYPGIEIVKSNIYSGEDLVIRYRLILNIFLSMIIMFSLLNKKRVNKVIYFTSTFIVLAFIYILITQINSVVNFYVKDEYINFTVVILSFYTLFVFLINIIILKKKRSDFDETMYNGLMFSLILFSIVQFAYILLPISVMFVKSGAYVDFNLILHGITSIAYISLAYSMIYYAVRNPLKVMYIDTVKKQIDAENKQNVLSKIFDISNDIILMINENDEIIEYNKNAVEYIKKENLLGVELEDIFTTRSSWQRIERMISTVRKKQKEESIEIELDFFGDSKVCKLIVVPCANEYSQDCIIYFRTEYEKMSELQIRNSTGDRITSLKNKFSFIEYVDDMLNKENKGIAVMCDINGLSTINQAYGYKIGDGIIAKVANLLSSNKLIEEAFHFSGGVFAFVIKNGTNKVINDVIKSINKEMKERLFDFKGISISFGTAKIEGNDNCGNIILTCEKNMYIEKAKESLSNKSDAINMLTQTLREKTNETEQHSKRVIKYSLMMCDKLKCDKDFKLKVSLLADLHDIGKIGISDIILNKPDKLNEREYEQIKKHSEIGHRIASTVVNLKPIANGILCHHERWDGKGYPKGIKGEEIPLMSRIVAIADTYDAITSIRPYKKALNKEIAKLEIKKNGGKQFDPNLVKIFLELV